MGSAAGRTRALTAALLTIVLVVGGTLALLGSRRLSAETSTAEEDAQMQRLLLLRGELAWVHLDLVVDSIYAAVDAQH